MAEKILNIASGKIPPLEMKRPVFLVNVDTMFYQNHDPAQVEKKAAEWKGTHNVEFKIKQDIFEFMERTTIEFDRVCIYRFLEHVSFTQVLYFIYLVSTVTKPGAIVDVIVPDYKVLAHRILTFDNPMSSNFEAENIELTTELLNEPSCPHASIWTVDRANYFWMLENRFFIDEIQTDFEFDGRDLYLRFIAKRK